MRHLLLPWILVGALFAHSAAHADVFTNVPEASQYSLVYELELPTLADYEFTEPAYAVDNSAGVGFFDRVAYYLELDDGSGLEYVYASMDAFTSDATRIGVPTFGSGAVFQQNVANMNVVSNVLSIVTGTGITTGNIEFWPTNYDVQNELLVPGASDAVYDFGDRQTPGNYGSMQVHNHGAGQTLLAYNQWGGNTFQNINDVGIGNQATGNPDWTFAGNADTYTVRRLQVLARPATPPPLMLSAPTGHFVQQRDVNNRADVRVEGFFSGDISQIEARAVPIAGFHGTATDWQVIDGAPTGDTFSGTFSVPAGWYTIEARTLDGNTVVGEASVDEVGVGEVFVTAGQSNSANWGSPPITPNDPRVSAYGPNGWQFGRDPQPIADGTNGGTPWPTLGEMLVDTWDVPVGFISVGVGGTRVDQWLPAGSLYPRLQDALNVVGPNGLRAVLWHQGESDYINGTTAGDYASRLQTVIAQSRTDVGFDVPWGVALASFVPGFPNPGQAVIDGQMQVISADPLVFEGASTDDLTGLMWRISDLIHFNEAGLREHGTRWWQQVLATFANPAATVGDYNNDGTITAADYTVWRDTLGQQGLALAADGDGSGTVDLADYGVWRTSFLAAVGTAASVPEPATIWLPLVVATVVCRARIARRYPPLNVASVFG